MRSDDDPGDTHTLITISWPESSRCTFLWELSYTGARDPVGC